jgi:hypothetical protein
VIRKIVAVTGLAIICKIKQAQETSTPESRSVVGDAVNRAFMSVGRRVFIRPCTVRMELG